MLGPRDELNSGVVKELRISEDQPILLRQTEYIYSGHSPVNTRENRMTEHQERPGKKHRVKQYVTVWRRRSSS